MNWLVLSEKENFVEENERMFSFIRENWMKRTDEIDSFSKRVLNSCEEINNEFILGCSNFVQHCLDLQKAYSNQFPMFFIPDLTRKIIAQNTDIWVHYVQNFDSVCVDCLKGIKNNIRAYNNNMILFLQSMQKLYNIYGVEKTQKTPGLEIESGETGLKIPKK